MGNSALKMLQENCDMIDKGIFKIGGRGCALFFPGNNREEKNTFLFF